MSGVVKPVTILLQIMDLASNCTCIYMTEFAVLCDMKRRGKTVRCGAFAVTSSPSTVKFDFLHITSHDDCFLSHDPPLNLINLCFYTLLEF